MTLLFSASVMSQNITVAELRSLQDDLTNEKYDFVKKKMDAVFHGKISESAPDSIKYYFYVINAAIEDQCNQNIIGAREYCLEAIKIRETRLGVLDPEYIELLWAMGSGYKETDIDRSVSYYQKAIVIGQTIMKNPQIIEESQWPFMIRTFGLVLGDLANAYEKKGWLNEVVELFNYGHALCSSKNLEFDVVSYTYKNQLAWFYEKYHNYGMAIKAYDEVLSLINERIGKKNKDYVGELYLKANAQCQTENKSQGISTYKEAIEIANEVLDSKDDLWLGIYGNYYNELAQIGDIESMNQVSATIRNIFPSQYSMTLDYCDCLALQKAKRYDESLALSSMSYLKLRQDNKETIQTYRDFFNLFIENYNMKNQTDSILIFCESEKHYLQQKGLAMQTMAYFDACNVEGVQYLNLNRYNDALLNFKDAERFCFSVFDKENGSHALIYHNLGRCYMQLKDYQNAYRYLIKSKDLQIQLYGEPMERTMLYLKEVETMMK